MTNNFRRKERVREMAEKSIDIAKETSVQDVLSDTTSLKATADTINTNTQSAKTDSSTIKSRMGTASDGTSATTLFGKINKLLTGAGISVADVKAYLNSTVGTSNEKSLDEMIDEKLSGLEKVNISENTETTVYSSTTAVEGSRNYYDICAAKFIGIKSGLYKVVLTGQYGNKAKLAIAHEAVTAYSSAKDTGKHYVTSPMYLYNTATVGDACGDLTLHENFSYFDICDMPTTSTTNTKTAYFYVKAGEPVVLVLYGSNNYSGFNTIKITC